MFNQISHNERKLTLKFINDFIDNCKKGVLEKESYSFKALTKGVIPKGWIGKYLLI